MNFNSNFIFPALLILFIRFRFLKARSTRKKMSALLKESPAIIDVRSIVEYNNANNPKSINLPLDTILANALAGISKDQQVIVCCASGMRSAMAVAVVKRLGYCKVMNAGAWTQTL